MAEDTLADLSALIRIRTDDVRGSLALSEAIIDSGPELTLSTEYARLTMSVNDADRRILADPAIRRRSWCEVQGPVDGKPVRFEIVRFSKSGDRFTLEYEDAMVAALRRARSPLSIPAGSTSRGEILARLCRESRVPFRIDLSETTTIKTPVRRNPQNKGKNDRSGGSATEAENSWDLGATLAEDRKWRWFSDGTQIVAGPDEWLIDRLGPPVVLRERSGAVHDIDFDLDIGVRVSEATVNVDAERWALPPGTPVRLTDEMGPAQGVWLVSEFRRPLTSTRAVVALIRQRHELDEPKRKPGPGDRGSDDFVPTPDGTTEGPATTPAREAMVRFALAQRGDAYVYGANGPDSWDCSGLVQEATRQAGRVLAKPSASQWAVASTRGRRISVPEGINTRGALLFRIGVGEFNHVAISLGNGSTIEARGSAYGTNVFGDARSQTWTGAALWI